MKKKITDEQLRKAIRKFKGLKKFDIKPKIKKEIPINK